MSHWGNTSTKIISEVLERTKGQSLKEINKALHDAYPFGERAMWPYKIWCAEVRRQKRIRQIPMQSRKVDVTGLWTSKVDGEGKG